MADDNRTEKATPRKRQDERKKGNIFQSREITNVFGLLIFTFVLQMLGPYYFKYFKDTIVFYINKLPASNVLESRDVTRTVADLMIRVMIMVLPLAVTAAVTAFVFTVAQTRGNFSKEQLKFQISRINILKGLKNFFSIKSLVELIKSMIKITVIFYILYRNISSNINIFMRMVGSDILEIILWIANTVISMIFNICVIMICFSIFDYFYQWWDYERRLRMTKEEIKNEAKQAEGDPQIKGKIREQQRSIARMRMMQKVPEADVVIKNPTHYAVAIKYDPENKKQKAPIVVAKGKGYIALKIIAIAEDNKVTVTENRPLARALYQSVKVGREIPGQFYQAVAEVLAII